MSRQVISAGNTRKLFAFGLVAPTSSDAGAKLCVGVPDKFKMVFLDLHEGKKAQLFQDNLHAFLDCAGLNVDDGATIGMFIIDMSKVPIKKPLDPASNADLTNTKIWESECS